MKKITIFLFFVLISATLIGATALAISPAPDVGTVIGQKQSSFSSLANIMTWLQTITNWIFVFVLVVAVIMFIYAGFIFITQGSDTNAQSQAKSLILYGIIGIAVILLAHTFIFLAGSIVGADVRALPFSGTFSIGSNSIPLSDFEAIKEVYTNAMRDHITFVTFVEEQATLCYQLGSDMIPIVVDPAAPVPVYKCYRVEATD